MDFFQNKMVKLIASILLVVSGLVLVMGGVTPETITDLIAKAVAGLSAVMVIVQAIIDIVSKDK